MKKILLLTIAVLAMSLGVNAEDVPYAEYKNGTLKFKYGDITSSSSSFVWNCENTSSMQAPWNDIKASVERWSSIHRSRMPDLRAALTGSICLRP